MTEGCGDSSSREPNAFRADALQIRPLVPRATDRGQSSKPQIRRKPHPRQWPIRIARANFLTARPSRELGLNDSMALQIGSTRV
jgi:hypothetical protein